MKYLSLSLSFLFLLIMAPPCFAQTMEASNPAAANCIAKGGTVTTKTSGNGGQYGVCQFANNQECEEWALLRDQCPVGGIKITGYTSKEAVYCAITGGTVSSDQRNCTFTKTCSTVEYYNGKC